MPRCEGSRALVILHLCWLLFRKGMRHGRRVMTTLQHTRRTRQNCIELLVSPIVLKCYYLGRIGRPDILWSVNNLARSVNKWTQACDRRLEKLLPYIHHTRDYRQSCHVGNATQLCRLGLFQDSDFAGGFEDSKPTSGIIFCIFGSRTFVPLVGCARSKHQYLTVPQNRKEIISSDAGLRMDDHLLSIYGIWC